MDLFKSGLKWINKKVKTHRSGRGVNINDTEKKGNNKNY